MKKKISILLVLTLLASCAAVLAETDQETTVPVFLIPSEFVDRFNAVMEAMAEQYTDQLGEDNVRILTECGTKSYRIIIGIYPDLPLVDYGFVMTVQILYRVF